jgi:hypothetical protein
MLLGSESVLLLPARLMLNHETGTRSRCLPHGPRSQATTRQTSLGGCRCLTHQTDPAQEKVEVEQRLGDVDGGLV